MSGGVPARPDRVLVVGGTVIEVWPDCVRTTLPSGAQLVAAPEDTDEYRARARDLGYGGDTFLMCAEHEVGHSLLAAWLGLAESPTLARVASGEGTNDLTNHEEDVVLAMQRFARAAGVSLLSMTPPWIARLKG